MTEQEKDKLLLEVKRLHDRHTFFEHLRPDTFEPGMMEYLDQSDGSVDFETGLLLLRFEARGTRYEGRPEIIERVQVNEPLQLVRDKENRFNPNNFTLLTNTGKNIGNMPAELCNALAPLYDKEELTIIRVEVSFVDPLSKRNRHAKRPMIFILLEGKVILKPEAEGQKGSARNPREPAVYTESFLEEAIPAKSGISQVESMRTKCKAGFIQGEEQLGRDSTACKESNLEEFGKQGEENNANSASAHIKSTLDQAQVQYYTTEDNYIFVEKDDIPSETLRAIRRSEYVRSVTAVMRFRKVYWRIRIRTTVDNEKVPKTANTLSPKRHEEKTISLPQVSIEEIKRNSVSDRLFDTAEENKGVEERLSNQTKETSGEKEVPKDNTVKQVEEEKLTVQSGERPQMIDGIEPASHDEETTNLTLASLFGIVPETFETVKIKELHLGVRAANCLSAVNCNTLKDVLLKSRSELLAIPFMSTKSLEEIVEKSKQYILMKR